MKIFYSWQSDTPREIGKDFIRGALDKAVAGLEIDDAERPEVDQDTAGVLGSPAVADTILRKIREAGVVVVDVTITGKTPAGKRLINSNIGIELGYALGVHGDGVLLKVMNTYYGGISKLPFDLQHHRWPVKFCLAPSATEPQRQEVADELTDKLREIIAQYIAAASPAPVPFSPREPTFSPAAYWGLSEHLVKRGDARFSDTVTELAYSDEQALLYLRIWPDSPMPALTAAVLGDYNRSMIEPLCGTRTGSSTDRNRHGQITYTLNEDHTLSASTQVFKSGEIWGIDTHLLRPKSVKPAKIFSASDFEARLARSFGFYLQKAADFGYSDNVHLQFGLVSIAGYHLALPSGHVSQVIYEENIRVDTTIKQSDKSSHESALMKIFTAVYDAAGQVRQ